MVIPTQFSNNFQIFYGPKVKHKTRVGEVTFTPNLPKVLRSDIQTGSLLGIKISLVRDRLTVVISSIHTLKPPAS